jgi:hypothetical protein
VAQRGVGHLDEVLENLGVFRAAAEELVQLCPSGFRRIPISQGDEFYFSIQALAPDQTAFAHTHPDSEEWTVVLDGSGEALIHGALPIAPGSIQVPRPGEGSTTWDEPGTTTDPISCQGGGRCRRCPRCGGHAAEVRRDLFECENCTLELS